MNEELTYYNNCPESLTGYTHGFKKSCDETGECGERLNFFSTPFRHPLAGIFGIVRRAYERYRSKTVAFREKRSNGKGIIPQAVKEAITSQPEAETNTSQPLSRKTTGGNSQILMLLRHYAISGQ